MDCFLEGTLDWSQLTVSASCLRCCRQQSKRLVGDRKLASVSDFVFLLCLVEYRTDEVVKSMT